MGLLSKIKSKKEDYVNRNNKEEPAENNPYMNTSMPTKENKFSAFGDYATQKRENMGTYGPRTEAPDTSRKAPQFEETWQEYKAKKEQEKTSYGGYNNYDNGYGKNDYNNNSNGYNNNGYGGYSEDNLNAPGNNYNPDDLNASHHNYDPDDLNADPEEVRQYDQPQAQQQVQRELTEEEKAQQEEEEELEDIKGELSFTRDKTLQSTQRIMDLADEAEMSGQNTLGMLGNQAKRMFDTENNLRLAHTQTRIATERAKELRTAGNVFRAPGNPFNKKSRLRAREEREMSNLIADRQADDRALKDYQGTERRVKENLGYYPGQQNVTAQQQRTRDAALRAHQQYLFEDEDEEEREKELQIGANMNNILSKTKNLKKIAMAQSDELERQNDKFREMEERLNNVTLGVDQNTARLKRISGK
ncbi:hypothetical protein DASC09_048960 [Saccharomycopsis crataegensis]|uniref:t-SNARE coiled-coil homology domain-containing protein n=1 Tax=Saccharomycopsis crataegensis TaxID=43959 RepID=A0AAV5QS70_9ASCO|nr:hypothetical protein DASC09_048960 [Saccharomycopsis crataegensis]